MDNKKKIQIINERCQNTLASNIGIEITDISSDYIAGKMPVDNRTVQPYGLLHGGASVVLSETLGSIGGGFKIDLNSQSVVGLEINANHLKSVENGWVYGKAVPIKIGKNIQVWETKIIDENNHLICVSRLTLAVINK